MSRLFSMLRRTVVGTWWALDVVRRTLLNLLLALLLLALAWWALRPGPPPLVPGTTLVLDLQGPLREQFTGSARDNLLRQARGDNLRQVRLRDVLAALDAAGRDPAIARVLLMTDDFAGAGPASLREVATALQRVRAAGKPVWAWSAGYSQAAYFLAAQADQVFLHPMGEVSIDHRAPQRGPARSVADGRPPGRHVRGWRRHRCRRPGPAGWPACRPGSVPPPRRCRTWPG